MTQPKVVAVACDSTHNIIKPVQAEITLIAGWGVEGDAHAGETIQHRYDKRRNPSAPNLRQIHLMHSELFDQMADQGMTVRPGQMGENLTTQNIDILALPQGTCLKIGSAVIKVTGLRNPCKYLNTIAPGLMKACLAKHKDGTPFPQSGVMGVIMAGGIVKAGDAIDIILPPKPHQRLAPV